MLGKYCFKALEAISLFIYKIFSCNNNPYQVLKFQEIYVQDWTHIRPFCCSPFVLNINIFSLFFMKRLQFDRHPLRSTVSEYIHELIFMGNWQLPIMISSLTEYISHPIIPS